MSDEGRWGMNKPVMLVSPKQYRCGNHNWPDMKQTLPPTRALFGGPRHHVEGLAGQRSNWADGVMWSSLDLNAKEGPAQSA